MRGILGKATLAAFGLVSLAGCMPVEAPQANAETGSGLSREMSVADRTACTSGGGKVERRGRMGMELCVRPYADAGKSCTDSSQCDGKCIGDAGAAPDAPQVAGQCQADDRLFGCYSEIKGGKAANAICVD